jgi:hypothetical protein
MELTAADAGAWETFRQDIWFGKWKESVQPHDNFLLVFFLVIYAIHT